jgi:hypothetical protein
MKLELMRKEVANIVDDSSFNPEDIDRYINEAIGYAAGLVRLPALKRVGTLVMPADAYSVSLTGISGDELIGAITYAVLSNGDELNILNGVEELLMFYPKLDSVGPPKDIAQEHQTLWFQPAMSAEYTATLVYYTKPALLSKNSDESSVFPEHLHRRLFVHGAAWMMFDMIEDGIEQDKKINTQSHFFHSFSEMNKESGIVKLREWIGTNRVHHISSTWRY